MRKGRAWIMELALAVLAWTSTVVTAQNTPQPNYGGHLSARPRLTGYWFCGRDSLSKHGFDFDLDLTQVLQGVASGGRDTGVDYDGFVNYELNLNSEKMGLWPGAFLKVKAITTYGTYANSES